MCRLLDQQRPESAPHKAYTAFRYAHPLCSEALEAMVADGVERVVAFSQYPQWCGFNSKSDCKNMRRFSMRSEFPRESLHLSPHVNMSGCPF